MHLVPLKYLDWVLIHLIWGRFLIVCTFCFVLVVDYLASFVWFSLISILLEARALQLSLNLILVAESGACTFVG